MITCLPAELLDRVFSYLGTCKDLKQVSLTCRLLHAVAQAMLWKEPVFKQRITPAELESLLHLPITVLHTKYLALNCNTLPRFVCVFQKMNCLKSLHIDNGYYQFNSHLNGDCKRIELCHLKHLQQLNVDVVLYHGAVCFLKGVHSLPPRQRLIEFLDNDIANIRLHGFRLDFNYWAPFWDMDIFKRIMSVMPVNFIDTKCLNITEDSKDKFLDVMCSLTKPCEVQLENVRPSQLRYHRSQYLFTLEDIEKMSNNLNIQIKHVFANSLDTDEIADADHHLPWPLRLGNSRKLKYYVKYLQKMKYLESFCVYDCNELDVETLELFASLPITDIYMKFIDIHSGNVGQIIDALSNMQHLKRLHIGPPSNGYQLALDDLDRFSHLPVCAIDFAAFDIDLKDEEDSKLLDDIIGRIWPSLHAFS